MRVVVPTRALIAPPRPPPGPDDGFHNNRRKKVTSSSRRDKLSSMYSFRATCDILNTSGDKIGRVIGFDKSITISQAVEEECDKELGETEYRDKGWRRGPETRLVILGYSKRGNGEIYLMLANGKSKVLVHPRKN
jgi:hypothetical protein